MSDRVEHVAAVQKSVPAKSAARKGPVLDWTQSRPAPVVLISGPETLLADRAGRAIRAALLAEDPSLEVSDIEASGYTSGELFTYASPSLFGEPRLIRVNEMEKASDAFLVDMKRYLESPAADTTVVLRHSSGQRGKGVLDLIRKGQGGAIEVACPEMKKDAERFAFLKEEFQRAGARADSGAVRMLGLAFTGDLTELAAAVQQLVADAGTSITEQTVERYYEGKTETNAFKVADAAIAGQSGDALLLLRHALDSGTAAIPLLAALNMKVRGMARVFGAHGSSAQLAKELGMAPWQVDRAQRDARGWREADLAHTIQQCAETEWLLKGGAVDSVYALEQLLLLVARRGRPVAHR